MNSVKISIIVPVYNAEKYLKDCVESILNQTFRDFELLLVDDGSKDNSLEICNTFKAQDNRVKVIHQNNAGSSAAKNAGISVACGEYIAFCDADDVIDKEYIANLYQGVILHNADLCVGNVAFLKKRNDEVLSQRKVEMTPGIFSLKDFMSFYPSYMPNAVIGAPWNKLYKKSIIDENSLRFNTNIKNNEDTHFNYQLIPKCKLVYVSNYPYYNYIDRVDNVSASKGFIPNIADIYIMTYNKALEFLKETNSFDQHINFQNKYFIGLIIGTLYGLANGNNRLSRNEKIKQIKGLCSKFEVQNAVTSVKFNNIKKDFFVWLIKNKQPKLIYYLLTLKTKRK